MRLQTALTALLTFALMSTGFAHALWIETEPKAFIGKAHPVRIFYGEYAAKEFEHADKWYSDVNTFVLWIMAPDGTKTKLNYSPAGDHYATSFTPDQDGHYVLTIGHAAKEINRGYVYQFNASASVRVGRSENTPEAIKANELYLKTEIGAKGKSQIVKAYYKGQPAPEITVTVSGPTGWSKNFKTDKNGALEFEPLWKGTYALEGFYTTEETGTHHEVTYDHIWRCATVRIEL